MTRLIISSMLAFLAATSPIQSANAQSGAVQVSTDSVEYPVQADSLKTLHFKELKYLLGKKWIQLQNGTYSDKYTIGSTDVSLEDFWLFDLRDGAPRHALVSIYSINCGGSCSPEGYALLFTIRSGKLVADAGDSITILRPPELESPLMPPVTSSRSQAEATTALQIAVHKT